MRRMTALTGIVAAIMAASLIAQPAAAQSAADYPNRAVTLVEQDRDRDGDVQYA